MRPYNRSLHHNDYSFLPDTLDLRLFQAKMQADGIPHREWHPHRIWEYASMLQQLRDLAVPFDAEIVDVGAGASFFDPYLALLYPNLCEIDCMMYETAVEQEAMVEAQRRHYGVKLPLYNESIEDLSGKFHEEFDVTMCISVIEHVNSHDAGFAELVRITKPGGYIFITSDYFKSPEHWEVSISKHLQVTPYTKAFVLALPERFGVEFVGETDLDYLEDNVHNYSFVNLCLRKPL
jgi:2-polyprenyl-3-methyl-5-hydroxy-6-metoxy-1,4-benzoquinol methylase